MFLPEQFKIWLSCEHADMRKAIDGLSLLVVKCFKKNPQDGDLFIFYNRKRDRLKILYWHYNGFMLVQKRLEKHGFKIPKDLDNLSEITQQQLTRLVEGLHFVNKGENKYDIFF